MMEVINPNQSIGMYLIFVSLIFFGGILFLFLMILPQNSLVFWFRYLCS